jgi:hypothetical protein
MTGRQVGGACGNQAKSAFVLFTVSNLAHAVLVRGVTFSNDADGENDGVTVIASGVDMATSRQEPCK